MPRSATVLLLAALTLMPVALALPATPTIVAIPGSWLAGYATPAAVTQVGGPLQFVNGDIMQHNVVSVALGPGTQPWCARFQVDRCPLFWSPLVNLAGSTPVQGLENVAPLVTYDYYCETHPAMEGKLLVLPAGA